MAVSISSLACQTASVYKGNGKFIFYVEVKPKEFTEGKDPALSYNLSSLVSFSIFNTEKQSSVIAYLNPYTPAYLLQKIKANMTREFPACFNTPVKGSTETLFALYANKDDELLKQLQPQQDKNTQMLMAFISDYRKKYGLPAEREVIINDIKTPNNKKIDAKGNTEVRILKIEYFPVKHEYLVTIENCMAPPAKGNVGALVSKAVDRVYYNMSFTEAEFFNIVDEVVHAKEMYAHASEASRIRYAAEHAWRPNSDLNS